jgi:protein-disulfide isomerase
VARVLALLLGACQNTTAREPKETPGQESEYVHLPGIDASALTPREKREWSTYVSEFLAPCGDVPVAIAQCVSENRACVRCRPAAMYLLKGVREGLPREQLEQRYKNRFDASKIHVVPLDPGSPQLGDDRAPITLVEFADFECPYCAVVGPMLEKTWQGRKRDVRVVYKFYPLLTHPHGEAAARAAIAAGNQGAFWPMHRKLFEHREHLETSDLDAYAKELGIDLAKFHADMVAPTTDDRLARDKKAAEDLMIRGTPTIFVNGRQFDLAQDLDDWIGLELEVAGR